MKVIDKRKLFKTNNSSEVLYGLHMSNALTMGGERCDECFGGKLHSNSCHSQLLNTIMFSRRAIFTAFLWGGGSLHSVNHDWSYYQRGKCSECLWKIDFTHKQIFKTLTRDNLGGGTLKWGALCICTLCTFLRPPLNRTLKPVL